MLSVLGLLGLLVAGQVQIGTLLLELTGPTGQAIPRADVCLYQSGTAFERCATTDDAGTLSLRNLPFGLYSLRVEALGYRSESALVRIESNLAVESHLRLEVSERLDESVMVRAATPLLDPGRVSNTTRIGRLFRERLPKGPNSGLQTAIAAAAGWSTEDNGLVHARGVDDGFLYIYDGVSLNDRVDSAFSNALDMDAFQSIEVLDGHLPAEYGNTSAGVIYIVPKSGLGESFHGSFAGGYGSLETSVGSLTLGGQMTEDSGAFVTLTHRGSNERFLDPVDPDNLNNRGNALRFNSRFDWRVSDRDFLVVDVSASGSNFRITNSFEQELAGQRQRQRLRDDHQSLLWQRTWSPRTLTDLSVYRHAFSARLTPSENDTPVAARQGRRHERIGLQFHLTHQAGGHLIKAGGEVQRVSPEERFEFFVVDPNDGEQAGLSGAALAFDRANPFVFLGETSRFQGSAFVQDNFSPTERLTVNAGLRIDATNVLQSDSAVSPRLGAVYAFPRWALLVRGSVNRLFKPPQVENLLLSSSPEARVLSPFHSNQAVGGGSALLPERQTAIEIGLEKALGSWLRLDIAPWWRRFSNQADPNVFLGTTIVFPNSVAEGRARGVDVRLVVPTRRGFSGFANYSNALVYQRGPINGGLFLEEEVVEIGPGVRFTPDHDQRHVGSFGITYEHRLRGIWLSVLGRYESGTPLEVDDDDVTDLMDRRGAELVDFERGRVRPRTLWDLSIGAPLKRAGLYRLELSLAIRNLTNARFAYNFANTFSGTHFGHPRMFSFRLKVNVGHD